MARWLRRLLGRHDPPPGRPDWLIIGLGNPGQRYAPTRHNVGRQVVDLLARRHGLRWDRANKHAALAEGQIAGRPITLARLKSYMNESGRPVAGLLQRYGLQPSRMLVVVDDLDLPLGRLRLRPAGGAGGHRGMESIIERVGTREFPRLRLGIGRPLDGDAVAYVLRPFAPQQEEAMPQAREAAAEALERILELGLEAAMSQVNAAA